MLKFRPIVYDDSNLRAFKYTASTAILEGRLCYFNGSDLNTAKCTLYNGVSPATLPVAIGGGTTAIFNSGKYFPVYREDPDVENVGATINQNDFVIGFQLSKGAEFEVHKDLIVSGAVASFTSVGEYVCLASTGKYQTLAGGSSTRVILGECMGTFGAKWLRVKAL